MRRSRFVLDHARLTRDVWFFGVRHNFPSLLLVTAFFSLLHILIEVFLLDFNCPFFSSQSLFDAVRLRLQKFLRIQWAVFVAGARMSEACVSLVSGMTQLTSALMRCDKLSKLGGAHDSTRVGRLFRALPIFFHF